MISTVESGKEMMKKQGDGESNAVDIVILPADNFNLLTDNKEVRGDDFMIDNGLPSDTSGIVQIQTNVFNRKGNDDKLEDDDIIKREKTESKLKMKKKVRVGTIERC